MNEQEMKKKLQKISRLNRYSAGSMVAGIYSTLQGFTYSEPKSMGLIAFGVAALAVSTVLDVYRQKNEDRIIKELRENNCFRKSLDSKL